MSEKPLKRFEKLENDLKPNPEGQKLRISRRFDLLEVENKKIKVTITDKIYEVETTATETTYYILCPYCSAQNTPGSINCLKCSQTLKSGLSESYRIESKVLKKCTACNTANQEDRRNCWLCGKEFTVSSRNKVNDSNIITLNIDGVEYKSSDTLLPFDVRIFMDKIRREGYKKELVDDWIKKRNEKSQNEQSQLKARIASLKSEYTSRIIGLAFVVVIALIFFIFKGC